jgi:biotin synthase-related radical SAM superfamily protein
MKKIMNNASPAYVQTSLAGAMALGLERGSFYRGATPGSLNILMTYPDGCRANCSYCGLARERSYKRDSQTFIRVKWPMYSLEKVIEILQAQVADCSRKNGFGRICVSMITHPQAEADCALIVNKLHKATPIPISVLVSPTAVKDVTLFFKNLQALGVDRVGIAIDTATAELFAFHRGLPVGGPHSWQKYWQAVTAAVAVFGIAMVSIHLVVGLGETEQQLVAAISKAKELGAVTHLFAFCAEPGSGLENRQSPSLGKYRRSQLAAYLLNQGIIDCDSIQFDSNGRIVSFGKSPEELLGENLAGGQPFMTSGCPDGKGCVACNRPYGNERPGSVLKNYPFIPNQEDLELIRTQIGEALAERELEHVGH